MTAHLASAHAAGDLDGSWAAFGKIIRYCPGASASKYFDIRDCSHHLDRLGKIFSKSAGRRLLHAQCRKDVLYVTETCEHLENDEDVGVFRGMFRDWRGCRTRRMLEARKAEQEEGKKCPFCGLGVWSMAGADMIPTTISKTLNCFEDDADYFVCDSGHLHGVCTLNEPEEESDAADPAPDETADASHKERKLVL
eukprot:SM000242S08492  [mRNA]  locus=s242:190313:191302:- [translate_table: standard]